MRNGSTPKAATQYSTVQYYYYYYSRSRYGGISGTKSLSGGLVVSVVAPLQGGGQTGPVEVQTPESSSAILAGGFILHEFFLSVLSWDLPSQRAELYSLLPLGGIFSIRITLVGLAVEIYLLL